VDIWTLDSGVWNPHQLPHYLQFYSKSWRASSRIHGGRRNSGPRHFLHRCLRIIPSSEQAPVSCWMTHGWTASICFWKNLTARTVPEIHKVTRGEERRFSVDLYADFLCGCPVQSWQRICLDEEYCTCHVHKLSRVHNVRLALNHHMK